MIGVDAAHATRSLYGAWRLARGDETGMLWFDATRDGFWRSFWAAAIIAPFYVLLLVLRLGAEDLALDPLRYAAAETIAYVISWTVFPVAMLSIAPMLERGRRYIPYIVAYNWATVLQNAIYMPVGILRLTGVLPPDFATFLSLLILGAILVYTWFITKTALDVNAGTAAGLVGLDFVLGIVVNVLGDAAALN